MLQLCRPASIVPASVNTARGALCCSYTDLNHPFFDRGRCNCSAVVVPASIIFAPSSFALSLSASAAPCTSAARDLPGAKLSDASCCRLVRATISDRYHATHGAKAHDTKRGQHPCCAGKAEHAATFCTHCKHAAEVAAAFLSGETSLSPTARSERNAQIMADAVTSVEYQPCPDVKKGSQKNGKRKRPAAILRTCPYRASLGDQAPCCAMIVKDELLPVSQWCRDCWCTIPLDGGGRGPDIGGPALRVHILLGNRKAQTKGGCAELRKALAPDVAPAEARRCRRPECRDLATDMVEQPVQESPRQSHQPKRYLIEDSAAIVGAASHSGQVGACPSTFLRHQQKRPGDLVDSARPPKVTAKETARENARLRSELTVSKEENRKLRSATPKVTSQQAARENARLQSELTAAKEENGVLHSTVGELHGQVAQLECDMTDLIDASSINYGDPQRTVTFVAQLSPISPMPSASSTPSAVPPPIPPLLSPSQVTACIAPSGQEQSELTTATNAVTELRAVIRSLKAALRVASTSQLDALQDVAARAVRECKSDIGAGQQRISAFFTRLQGGPLSKSAATTEKALMLSLTEVPDSVAALKALRGVIDAPDPGGRPTLSDNRFQAVLDGLFDQITTASAAPVDQVNLVLSVVERIFGADGAGALLRRHQQSNALVGLQSLGCKVTAALQAVVATIRPRTAISVKGGRMTHYQRDYILTLAFLLHRGGMTWVDVQSVTRLSDYVIRQAKAVLFVDGKVVIPPRKTRSDAFPTALWDRARRYWNEMTRPSEEKNGFVCSVHNRTGERHRIHWLYDPLCKFYEDYCSQMVREHSESCTEDDPVGAAFKPMSSSAFMSVRPFWVKKAGIAVCLCGKCLQCDLIAEAVRNAQRSHVLRTGCQCHGAGPLSPFCSMKTLEKQVLCPKVPESDGLHESYAAACVYSTCKNCGWARNMLPRSVCIKKNDPQAAMEPHNQLRFCPVLLASGTLVPYQLWTKSFTVVDGKKKDTSSFVTQMVTFQDLVDALQAAYGSWVLHKDKDRVQNKGIRVLKESLGPHSFATQQDYSENGELNVRAEWVQRHWVRACILVSLHPCTLVSLCPSVPVSLYPCIPVSLYPCIAVSLYPCIIVPLYHCIIVPLCPCIFVSLYPCIPVSLYPCIPVSLCLCILVSQYPCILVSLYPCIPASLYPCISASPVSPVSLFPCILCPCVLASSLPVTAHGSSLGPSPLTSVGIALLNATPRLAERHTRSSAL